MHRALASDLQCNARRVTFVAVARRSPAPGSSPGPRRAASALGLATLEDEPRGGRGLHGGLSWSEETEVPLQYAKR
jgi:hypothetical protein